MIYRKVPSQKIITKQGDCVIHVPNNYGGTALLEEVYEDEDIQEETLNTDVEYQSESIGEGERNEYYAIDEEISNNTSDENGETVNNNVSQASDVPVINKAHTTILGDLLDGFGIDFEELLLIGLILLVIHDGNAENDDLVLILAFLLLRK